MKRIKYEYNNNDEFKPSPTERMGHVCQVYSEKFLILWGGCKMNERMIDDRINAATLWIFNTELEKWNSVECSNSPPLASSACSIIVDDSLYVFGGFNSNFHSNQLYRLSIKDFIWEKCPVSEKMPSPRDKFASWFHDQKLFFFGGFGPNFKNKYLDKYGEFISADENNSYCGWNNQIVYYDMNTRTWHEQKCLNKVPGPRAAHTCTKINENQLVVFGGRKEDGRTNELFILDLKRFSWSDNLSAIVENKEYLPCGRSWHSMVKIDTNNLFMYGGLSEESDCLGDGWMLDTTSFQWTRISTKLETRLWHTSNINPKDKQVYIVGGSCTDVFKQQPTFSRQLLQVSLTPNTLKSKCIDSIVDNIQFYENDILKRIPSDLERIIVLKYSNSLKSCRKKSNICLTQ